MADQSNASRVWIVTWNGEYVGAYSSAEKARAAREGMDRECDIWEADINDLDRPPTECWEVLIRAEFLRKRLHAMLIKANGQAWPSNPNKVEWSTHTSSYSSNASAEITLFFPVESTDMNGAIASASNRWNEELYDELRRRLNEEAGQ